MENVIYVDFSAKANETRQERYLRICAETLADNDFEDLIDAINDPSFYQKLDDDMQDIVDGYFAQTA